MGAKFFMLLMLNVFVTMVAIVIIKKVSAKYHIPLVSTVAEAV